MKKHKKVLPAVIAVVLLALIAGGVMLARKKASGGTVSVYPVSSVGYYDMGENRSMWGEVTDSAMQEIRLGSSLVDSIKVKVGKQVKKGDTLLVYNKESVKLTLQGDEAAIALLEAEIASAKQEIERYQTLRPSEELPEPVEQVIHHTAKPVKCLKEVTPETAASEGDSVFFCSADTKVTKEMLEKLDDEDAVAEFRIYENNTEIGRWLVDGSKICSGTTVITIIREPEEQPVPGEPENTESSEGTEGPTGEGSAGEEADSEGADAPAMGAVDEPSATVMKETRTEEQGPYEDWILGEGVEFNGDGTVSVDYSYKHYGTLISVVPEETEWDEIVVIDPGADISGENYMYSRKELAEMIREKTAALKTMELDLKSAELKLEQDKLISSDGKVRASMDGVVTEVKDPKELKTGDSLITVRGNSGFTVTVHVSEYEIRDMKEGEILHVMSYESASMFDAEITHISLEPEEGQWYGGENATYYPVTAAAMDPELELTRGEGCEVTRDQPEGYTGALIIPTMLVRKDEQGSYCMIADENNRLKRVAVKTGKTFWGDSVEIREGLTEEDRIAFPYGKSVKEGSPVVDKDNIYDEY